MTTASVELDLETPTAPVPKRLFGTFVEHVGRCVYTGLYEPGHPTADALGLRGDVLALTRELGPTVVRYPGGNFVSGYDWEDGVGPDRPVRLELAWHELETNRFGLHEFAAWARDAGVEIMYAVNLGSRGLDAARHLVEYANHPGGTARSDERRANGAEEPFGIRLWCLGNEMDGEWQIGHKTAEEYGRLAVETARVMRAVDPGIELVLAGSSSPSQPTFGEWERTVLRHCVDEVDHLSLHFYVQEHDGDGATFLADALTLERYIDEVTEIIDEISAETGTTRRIGLAIDEWNVWNQERFNDPAHQAAVQAAEWVEHPRVIEDVYTVTDAVVVGTMLHTLLRRADRVTIANLAQLVNVIGPIMTEPGGPAWRQTTFFPFARIAALASGEVVPATVECPRVASGMHGEVPQLDVAATASADRVAVFLANRSLDEAVTVRLGAPGRLREAVVLWDADRTAANTLDAPERVGLRPLAATADDDALEFTLPPVSWAALDLARE